MRGASGDGLEIRLDPASFGRLMRAARAYDAELAKAVRKRLRVAANEGVKDVKQRLLSRPFHTDAGLAAGLAAGTRVSIKTGIKTGGVSIVTTGSRLPAGKQAMVRAYDKPSFRHPVFGNRDVWVTQAGRPYFGAVLDERKPAMRAAVEQALADAAATLEGATRR
jgi:hypothetical protein